MNFKALILITLFSHPALAAESQLQMLSDSIVIQKNALHELETIRSVTTQPEKSAIVFQKIIENEEKLSTIQFKLANVIANESEPPAALDLASYQETLKKVLDSSTAYLTQYSKMSGAQNVLLTRAKTYQLLERNDLAEVDYAQLAFSTPHTALASTGAASLIFLRYDTGKYESVIITADKLNLPENDPYYFPIQVKRIASLGKTGKNKESIQLLTALLMKKNKMDAGTLRDALATIIEVYVAAMHEKTEGATLPNLVQILKNSAPPTFQYSPLELIATRLIVTGQSDQLLSLESFAPDLVPAVDREDSLTRYFTLILDHQVDHKLYADSEATLNRLRVVSLPSKASKKSFPKLYRVLTRNLEKLRTNRLKMTASNSSAAEIESIDRCLLSGFQVAILIPDHPAGDNYVLHFNLAETAFRMKRFDIATQNYVAANALDPLKAIKDMKQISSRYEELMAKHAFPEEIAPISIPGKDVKKIAVDPLFSQWTQWIDQKSSHLSDFTDDEKRTISEFDYSAARALYGNYDTVSGVQRLIQIIQNYPTQAVALKSTLLLFDTEIQSKAWEQIVKTSTTFLNQFSNNPKVDPEIIQKLTAYRYDADFQMVQEAFLKKDYQTCFTRGNQHLETFQKSPHRDEVLSMLGIAAAGTGDRKGAQKYFSKTDLSKATNETRTFALANDVDASVHDFDLVGSSDAYLRLLQNGNLKTADEKNKVATSALEAAWMSQNTVQLEKVMAQTCGRANLAPEPCNDYGSWISLVRRTPPSNRKASLPLGRALKVIFELQTDLAAIGKLPGVWNDLSAAEKSALIPYVESYAHAHLAVRRDHIRKLSPIVLEPAAINKRVQLLGNLEKVSEATQTFSWTSIQFLALKTVALAYQDFYRDILDIKVPKGMSEKEKTEFKGMLAQNADPFRIKASTFDAAATNLHPMIPENLTLEPAIKEIKYTKEDPSFKAALVKAIQEKRAVSTSYLLQQSQRSGFLAPQGEKVVMASILALTGGYTESEAIFREAKVMSMLQYFKPVIPPVRTPATVTTGGSKP